MQKRGFIDRECYPHLSIKYVTNGSQLAKMKVNSLYVTAKFIGKKQLV